MKKIIRVASAVVWILALGACSSNPPVDSRVQETDNLITALHAARELADEFDEEDILVIFDLDNTLLTMNTAVGSDTWYRWQSSLQDQTGCVPERVPELLHAQSAAFFASSMRPTQPDVGAIIRRLQEEDFRVMVLTARGLDFRLSTFRELRRNNLDFSDHAIPMDEDSHFSGLTYFPVSDARAVLYEDGVFMVAGQHKGKMLESLLQRLDWEWPDAVVMLDDTEHNIQDMRSTLGLLNIPYRLYRYGGVDDIVAEFDRERAMREWEAAAPALKQLEDVFGTVNYTMPDPYKDPACQ